jgi:SAM-dependent methyltransferase
MLFEERSRAESFGSVAELYDRVRPSYPSALVEALLEDGPGSVLDVGCGTGIAAAQLAACGCSVLGVEVDERMAAVARARGLEVEVAGFERWQARGRRFELVISGQAWHWIDPTAGVEKAADVLRERGRIGVFWNFGEPPAELAERLGAIYSRLEPDLESYSALLGSHRGRDRATLLAITASGRFDAPRSRTFPWSESYETTAWLELLQTHSDHRSLPEARRRRLLSAIGEAVDSLGGRFEMPYRAVLVSARRAD